jgi:serine phosphatase RsbU (regulator of sigma subunit)
MVTRNHIEQSTLKRLIQRVPFIGRLPAEEMDYLIQVLYQRQFPADTILFNEGEAGDRLSILIQGKIEIIKSLGTENERCLSTLKAGDIFGEASLLFPDRHRYASARTMTPVLLLEMLHSDFETLMLRQPKLGIHVMREMTLRWSTSEQAVIRELSEKNLQLLQANQELKQAQMQLIEKERIEHELALAQKIQQGILPKETPAPPGWQIMTYWQPAHAVGGDFYDFITLPKDRISVLIGDATGKGIPAALVMATTCSILRAILAGIDQDPELSPGKVLALANDLLCQQMPPGMFITCLLALFDLENGNLRYANAGQCLPYHLSRDGISELRATGMPLGLLPGMDYEDQQALIKGGDSVVLFSDGLVEAHNPVGQMLGTPGVQQILLSSQQEVNLILPTLAALTEFTGASWEQEDDLTVVTVSRL